MIVRTVQQAQWIKVGEAIPSDFGRIYLGSDTDRNIMNMLVANIAWIKRIQPQVTVVVPPLVEDSFILLEELTILLSETNMQGFELCLNDIGSFVYAAQIAQERGGFLPTVGRWLARGEADPVISQLISQGHVTPELAEHWSTPSALCPTTARLLRSILGKLPLQIETDSSVVCDILHSSPDVNVVINRHNSTVALQWER